MHAMHAKRLAMVCVLSAAGAAVKGGMVLLDSGLIRAARAKNAPFRRLSLRILTRQQSALTSESARVIIAVGRQVGFATGATVFGATDSESEASGEGAGADLRECLHATAPAVATAWDDRATTLEARASPAGSVGIDQKYTWSYGASWSRPKAMPAHQHHRAGGVGWARRRPGERGLPVHQQLGQLRVRDGSLTQGIHVRAGPYALCHWAY
jgi:hypothetical protein